MIIYIEKTALDYIKTKEILKNFKKPHIIEIERYTDVFNRKNQDFLNQKIYSNVIILAKKHGEFVMKNPPYCTSHIKNSYYFSTTLNCPFDCEYCFLHGMYLCSYPVIFINTYDFKKSIELKITEYKNEKILFFSGYDNDSFGFDQLTNYNKEFIDFFSQFKNAYLELRTKSANIKTINDLLPTKNVILSWTLSPLEIQKTYEHRTSSLNERIKAIKKVISKGWEIGIRIEPVFYYKTWKEDYSQFFSIIKKEIDFSKIENIYFGSFKMPKSYIKKLQKMYPYNKLLHTSFEEGDNNLISYPNKIIKELNQFIYKECIDLIDKERIFYNS